MTIRKTRRDKGIPRIKRTQAPRPISVQMIPDDPIEGAICKALDTDLSRLRKSDARATIKTVLIDWLSDYLGLKKA